MGAQVRFTFFAQGQQQLAGGWWAKEGEEVDRSFSVPDRVVFVGGDCRQFCWPGISQVLFHGDNSSSGPVCSELGLPDCLFDTVSKLCNRCRYVAFPAHAVDATVGAAPPGAKIECTVGTDSHVGDVQRPTFKKDITVCLVTCSIRFELHGVD